MVLTHYQYDGNSRSKQGIKAFRRPAMFLTAPIVGRP